MNIACQARDVNYFSHTKLPIASIFDSLRCDPQGIKNFLLPSQEGTITITTSDSPGHELDGPVYGKLDYLYLDHKFEMYVVYFVAAGASVRRVLAKLPWSFGGVVEHDPLLNPTYRETATIRVDEPIYGEPSVNVQTPYFGNASFTNKIIGWEIGSVAKTFRALRQPYPLQHNLLRPK